MKKIILFIFLTILFCGSSKAQVDKKNPIIRKQLELVDLMSEITDQVKINDLLYKRVALASFDYPEYIINESEAAQIRSRIEGAFAISGFTVVSAPEFKQKPLTIVNGTDSNLTITRQNTLERLTLDEDMMNEVIDKYALQALLYVQLTYDHITGFQVNLQLVKSRSKELIYSTVLNSNPEMYNPRKAEFQLSAGISFYKTQFYLVDNIDQGDKSLATISDVNVTWRQPFNKNKSGYYGFKAGMSYLQLMQSDADTSFTKFNKIMPQAGFYYSLCFLKKADQPRKYWMEAFQAMSVIISNEVVPYVRQGLIVNMTENLSLELDFRYYLVNSMFTNTSTVTNNINTLQLQNFGYGFSFIYRP